MTKTPIIDPTKVEAVVDLLRQIIEKSGYFQDFYKKLNRQERVVVGSLVVAIESPWGELSFVSFLGDEGQVSILINRLSHIFSNRQPVDPASGDVSGGGKNDRLVN